MGSLLSANEHLRRRTPVSNNTMESMNKIWPHQRLHLNQNSKIPTWGLTKAQIEEVNRAHK